MTINAPLTLCQITRPNPQVDALLAQHFADMRAGSPEDSCHVMTAQALRASGAQVFALLETDGTAAAIGAIKPIESGAELKSMHTAKHLRGSGLGRSILTALLDAARDTGAQSIWLETGTAGSFAPARALYRSVGFVECSPFGAYKPDPLSTFMTLDL